MFAKRLFAIMVYVGREEHFAAFAVSTLQRSVMRMSMIHVKNLSFHYEGSPDDIFTGASFQIDTDWKVGLIGRNGRGKTTFLRLLMGGLPYQGEIDASVQFEYFPYAVPDPQRETLAVVRGAIAPFDAWDAEMNACLDKGDEASLDRYGVLQEQFAQHDGYQIDELIAKEAGKLRVDPGALSRPFDTLSNGERTKLLIAALFLKKNAFLLIDEPTNHLDAQGRQIMEEYLNSKKGFLLVSHDRALLDGVIDHVLSINRASIEVQRGNYSSWQHNKDLQDQYETGQNEQLRGEIGRLTGAMRRNAAWSDKIESTKIGTHSADRGFIGAQSARMMKRSKAIERRTHDAIDEKSQLLKNIDTAEALKLHPLQYAKKRLVEVLGLTVDYGQGPLFAPVSFTVERDERVAVQGPNGSGKSSILKLILGQDIPHQGQVLVGGGLVISYVSQDTSHLRGTLKEHAQREGVDLSLLLTILRKLDFERKEFERPMEAFSEGQKKKVLLAASLATSAHLYIWDEPLNFVDILSRIQIENLLAEYPSTMIFVEHDRSFVSAIATRTVTLEA